MQNLECSNPGAKIAIIGSGRIGSNVLFQAYDKLGRKGLTEEIILIGRDKEKVSCICEEIRHANDGSIRTFLKPSVEPRDAVGCDIVVYAAGRTIRPGEKRENLLEENGALAESITCGLKFNGNEAFITITNPVDVLNTYFSRELGLPAARVIGLGGMLDSMRFRQTVLEHMRESLNVEIKLSEVRNALVLGQHGDHMVPLFDMLEFPSEIPRLSKNSMERIREELGAIVPRLIKVRGCADFAPSAHAFRIMQMLLCGSSPGIECCSIVPPKKLQMHYCGEVLDVSLGMPIVIGQRCGEVVKIEISKDDMSRIDRGAREIGDGVARLYEILFFRNKRR